MEISNLIPHIEALIFASDRPLTTMEISDLVNQAFGFMEDKVIPEQVDAALSGIIEKYQSEFYPFEVRQSGGGWQFLTKKEYHKTVAQLNGEKFLKRLSAATLETLAIIAYKQPITKGEIESIRGVSTDYSIQKLLEKELVVITGRNEKLPGHPLVYATSKNFMDYFGINSPEDLPKIREVLASQVIPTNVQDALLEQEEALAVTDDGSLIARSPEDENLHEEASDPAPENHSDVLADLTINSESELENGENSETASHVTDSSHSEDVETDDQAEKQSDLEKKQEAEDNDVSSESI